MGPRLQEVKTQPGNRLVLLVEAVKSRPGVLSIILCEGLCCKTFLQLLFELIHCSVRTPTDSDLLPVGKNSVLILLKSEANEVFSKLNPERPPILFVYDPMPIDDLPLAETSFKAIFHFKLLRGGTGMEMAARSVSVQLEKLVNTHYALRHAAEDACLEFYKSHYSDSLLRTSIHKSFLLPTAIRPPPSWKINRHPARKVKIDQAS